MGRKPLDLTAQRFGKLIARSCLGRLKGIRSWSCDCDCGTHDVVVQHDLLRRGVTRSCGCLRLDMMRKRMRPSALLPQVVLLREQGTQMRAIAERLGISLSWVATLLRQAKAPPDPRAPTW